MCLGLVQVQVHKQVTWYQWLVCYGAAPRKRVYSLAIHKKGSGGVAALGGVVQSNTVLVVLQDVVRLADGSLGTRTTASHLRGIGIRVASY